MKNKLKFMLFAILIILVLALSFGCTNNSQNTKNDLSMELGFLNDKYVEDDKSFIEIKTAVELLKFEILNDDLFESLINDEYYILAYNENKEVTSIEKNSHIKDLVLESMNKDEASKEKVIITKSDKFDTSDLTLLDAYFIDIDGDGIDEKISMYTAAEKDSNGEIMWDDGQDWLLSIEGEDYDYVLFNDYIQIGSMQYFVYVIEDNVYISTISSSTANLEMIEYKFNKETKEFEGNTKFTTQGNVIMLHSSK